MSRELEKKAVALREDDLIYAEIARRLNISTQQAWFLCNHPMPDEPAPKCQCGCDTAVTWNYNKACWNSFYIKHHRGKKREYKIASQAQREINRRKYGQLVSKLRLWADETDREARDELICDCLDIIKSPI